MRSLLVCFLIVQIANCSCPNEFELVREGECRGKYALLDTYWDVALSQVVSKCKEIQGKPVIIHDQEDQTYWKDHAGKTITQIIITGLTCNISTKRWEWSDGSALTFKPPSGKYSPALDKDCVTGYSWDIHPDGGWYYSFGHVGVMADCFCSTQLPPLPTVPAHPCDGFEEEDDDGSCFQVTSAENWQDALMTCINLGANIASIHTSKENSFVRRLAVSKGSVTGLFLGAIRKGVADVFTWSDGSEWNYENFYPDYPMDGNGDCVAMDTKGTTGQWINTDCSSKISVACERTLQYSPHICSSGPWKEGDIIFSPGFPFDSSIPCDFNLNVEVGKKVQVEILLLEANSCCDHLLLFSIGGNVIADLTGEISNRTYTIDYNSVRASWQPKGGVNVKGIMMTFRGV